MSACSHCDANNPATARYCMACGRPLRQAEDPAPEPRLAGFSMFTLSIAASVLLSLVLIYVFKLPIFFLAGFLPLLWSKRR